jgi:hypothetical protein
MDAGLVSSVSWFHVPYSLTAQRASRTFGRLNCCWSSPEQSFLVLGPVWIHDQKCCSLLDVYVFRSGASTSTSVGVRKLLITSLLLGVIRGPCLSDWLTHWLTDWLTNWCWSSWEQWFLVRHILLSDVSGSLQGFRPLRSPLGLHETEIDSSDFNETFSSMKLRKVSL